MALQIVSEARLSQSDHVGLDEEIPQIARDGSVR